MIYTDKRINASGPRSNVALAAIGMAPQKWEVADGIPFTGPSGRIFNDCLTIHKMHRSAVYVTNICNFYIDDNDLYSVPEEIMEAERRRVFDELDKVKPNCLLVMGADTLDLLTAKSIYTTKKGELATYGSKKGIIKWRGSIFELETPSGRKQKCVAAMHPASFIRGQWKWLPLYKYIDVQRAVIQSSFPDMRLTSREAITGPSFRAAKDFLREANQKEWLSIDYEGRSHLTCLGIGWMASQAMCLPLSRVGASTYWTLEEEIEIWRLWCGILQNPKVKKIAQNAAYEWIKSWMYGIYPNPLGMDTMHMHHCLYPDWGGITDEWAKRKRDIDNPGHGLALITSQYTDQPFYKDDGRHWTPELGEDAFWRYNCLDVMVTFEAAMKMQNELQRVGLWGTYCEMYRDVFEHTIRMEWLGTPYDLPLRDATRASMLVEMKELGEKLKEATGFTVITKTEIKGQKPLPGVLNLASPKQLAKFLYEVRKYPVKLNRKTGAVSTDRDVLQALAIKHNDEGLRGIINLQAMQNLLEKVIDVKLDDEGRIHCHFRIGGTNGTRWSSTESILESGTNLQNIHRQGVARSLFIPN